MNSHLLLQNDSTYQLQKQCDMFVWSAPDHNISVNEGELLVTNQHAHKEVHIPYPKPGTADT